MAQLELDENPAFQHKQLKVARIAVALFVVVIGLALLGVFGSGPLSHATAGGARDRFKVDYQRFLRFGESTSVKVRLRTSGGTKTVTIDGDYLDGFDVDGVLPEPDSQTARNGRLVFTFEDGSPSVVQLSLIPGRIGLRRARLSVDGSRSVTFRQLVYP